MTLVGARPDSKPEGLDRVSATTSYFIGKNPRKWRHAIPNYGRVRYPKVYPGVDVVYYGKQRQLEFDLELAPHANPNVIRLALSGADQTSIAPNGDLLIRVKSKKIALHQPIAYQQNASGEKLPVSVKYRKLDAGVVGIELASYDRSRPLVVDPILTFSTYFGGSVIDLGTAVAADASGNAYVTGFTCSGDFPATLGAAQPNAAGGCDAFVAKFSAAGALVYSTYLGGSGFDEAHGIAVDASGAAYVTGQTSSVDFQLRWAQTLSAIRTLLLPNLIRPDRRSSMRCCWVARPRPNPDF